MSEGNRTMSSSSSKNNWHEGQEFACGGECDGRLQVTLPLTGQPWCFAEVSGKPLSSRQARTPCALASPVSFRNNRAAGAFHGVGHIPNRETQKPNLMQVDL